MGFERHSKVNVRSAKVHAHVPESASSEPARIARELPADYFDTPTGDAANAGRDLTILRQARRLRAEGRRERYARLRGN